MDPQKQVIPAAAIIPTMNRAPVLTRTLESLFQQDTLPESIIIVDASPGDETKNALEALRVPPGVSITYARATIKGAAHQRSQALSLTNLPYVVFMDDDVILEPECVRRVYLGFSPIDSGVTNVGGVNAMITNQRYTKPGFVTKTMYRLMDRNRATWAGLVIGPAWNLLPEDDPQLPAYVKCEWLNLGCTMYRRDVLPIPLFPETFSGYSLFEDLTLSLKIGKTSTLLNARTAQLFHDSQPGDYKRDVSKIAEMEFYNRYFVMTKVLGRTGFVNYWKFFVFQWFGIVSGFISSRSLTLLFANIRGKIRALKMIIR